MGIYIGDGDNNITFKALYHELKLADEGYNYDVDSIKTVELIEKLSRFIGEKGPMASTVFEYMGENKQFVFGSDVLSRTSFAVIMATKALSYSIDELLDGKTEIIWG